MIENERDEVLELAQKLLAPGPYSWTRGEWRHYGEILARAVIELSEERDDADNTRSPKLEERIKHLEDRVEAEIEEVECREEEIGEWCTALNGMTEQAEIYMEERNAAKARIEELEAENGRMEAAIRTVLADYNEIANEDQSVLYLEIKGWMRYLCSALPEKITGMPGNTDKIRVRKLEVWT